MKHVQISVPAKKKTKIEKVVEKYSKGVTSAEGKKDGKKIITFSCSLDSKKLDKLTKELKDSEHLKIGELTIRILEETALVKKGGRAKGISDFLSFEEMKSKAVTFASFSKTAWALLFLSSAIAAYGIVLDNVPVIVGAMLVAPLLSPFISASFFLATRDEKLIAKGLTYGLVGIFLVIFTSFFASLPVSVTSTNLLKLLIEPDFRIMMLLSLFIGGAAALAFTSGSREQFAGVAVAIALVPPAAAAGISIKLLNSLWFFNALSLVFMNALSLIFAGFVTFKIIGIRGKGE
jgi:uncharacterized hydrophobic protein (TIGR00341 family)